MPNLARFPVSGEPRLAAPPHFFTLLGMLPALLAQLPDDVRATLGRAVDARLVRLALDENTGAAVVTRGFGR